MAATLTSPPTSSPSSVTRKSQRILETAPILPEFELSLKPDEYELPPLDFSWKKEDSRSSLKLPKCKAFIE